MTLPTLPHAPTLRLPDELMLLSLRDEGSLRNAQSMDFALSGAALLELLLAERIEIDGKQVVARGSEPLGYAPADVMLEAMRASRARSLNHWIRKFRHKLNPAIADSLVRAELVSRADLVNLGPVQWTRYPPLPGDIIPQLRQRVGLALTDGVTDDRTTILVALLDTVGLLKLLVPAVDWAARGPRVRDLIETSYSKQSVAAAVKAVRQEIQSAKAAGA